MVFSNPTSLVATLLSASLFLTNCALAHSTESNFWSERRHNRPLQVAALPTLPQPALSTIHPNTTVPEAYGTFRKVTHNPNASQKTVIHIQDIHQNFEAQENIGKAVQEWLKGKKVGLVALEGTSGDINLERFQTFFDQSVIRTVSNYLLKKNRISGPIHTALTNGPTTIKIVGIDDETHYRANIEAYKGAAKQKEAHQEEWRQTFQALTQEKQKFFSPELLAFDSQIQSYRDEKISLSDHLKHLKAKSGSPSMVDVFLETLEMEELLDFKKAEVERSRLLASLASKLNEREVVELTQLGLQFKSGAMRQAEFYQRLLSLCSDKKIPMNLYPALHDYVRYVLLSEKIDTDRLFSDMQTKEAEIFTTLAKTRKERELVRRSHQLHLTGKLLEFALTKEEWEKYSSPSAQNGEARRGNLAAFENFYKEAEIRDRLMAKNLLRQMERTNASFVVLVTGGFHSKGIDQALKQAGINAVTFVPKVTKIDSESGSHYLTAFTQERSPLDQLFSGSKLFLALPPAEGVGVECPVLSAALKPLSAQQTLDTLAPKSNLHVEADKDSIVVTNSTTKMSRRIKVRLENSEIAQVLINSAAATGLSWNALFLLGQQLSMAQTSLLFFAIATVLYYFGPKGPLQVPLNLQIDEVAMAGDLRLLAKIHLDWRGWTKDALMMTDKKNSRTKKSKDFFSKDAIDAILKSSGTNFEELKTFVQSINPDEIKEINRIRTREEALHLIPLLSFTSATLFPYVYNRLKAYITVSEFLVLILRNPRTTPRNRSLLRWWPLIKPYLKLNDINFNLEDHEDDTILNINAFLHRLQVVDPDGLYSSLSLFPNSWVGDISDSYSEEIIDEILRRNEDFTLLHILPWGKIPKKILTKRSARLPLRFESLRSVSGISFTPKLEQYAGNCQDCQNLHWETLVDKRSANYGNTVIIRIQGQPLFALKMVQDPSMVALDTTVDKNGRLLTIKGGVYTSKQIVEIVTNQKKRGRFPSIDIKAPVRIHPLAWIDSASNGNTWDKKKLDVFMNRLDAVRKEFSGGLEEPTGLSLLQGPAEALIHKYHWTGWKARTVRWGMAFVVSPLWEEAAFRVVMIGIWKWDPLLVGLLFLILHIPQNILFSMRDAHHQVDANDETFPENIIRSWADAFTLRLFFQFLGVMVVTYFYINTSSYWLMVAVHSAYNITLKLIGMPNTYLSLLSDVDAKIEHLAHLPRPQSLQLKNFLQKLDASDFPREQKPWAENLVAAWSAVHEKHVSLVAALVEAKLLDLKRPTVIVLSQEQNTPEVRRTLAALAKGSSKVFVVAEGQDIVLVDGRIHASDVDTALQKSKQWRQLSAEMHGMEETINIVKPAAMGWVSDVPVGSLLSRVQKILALEELLQVLSFLNSPQPSLEMLKRAAEAVARAA